MDSAAKAELLARALKLSARERLDIAAELLASVDPSEDPGREQASAAELDRRAENEPSLTQSGGRATGSVAELPACRTGVAASLRLASC